MIRWEEIRVTRREHNSVEIQVIFNDVIMEEVINNHTKYDQCPNGRSAKMVIINDFVEGSQLSAVIDDVQDLYIVGNENL